MDGGVKSRTRASSTDGAGDAVVAEDRTQKRYEVAGNGFGARSKTSVRDFTVQTDLPRSSGGTNTAAEPVELLLSALIGCESATAAFVARNMRPRMMFHGLRAHYTAHRDQRGALGALPITDAHSFPPERTGLARVSGEVIVFLAVHPTASQEIRPETEQRLRTLEQQTHARCPVASMLRASGCDMSGIRWRFAEAHERIDD
eukprot:CAMPEP_0185834850 /NCGR_PEP_ID=MMETSP1353-20130828/6385_1 /TAXON_ID=1077150 /ORGANISM="Erythrolobus australicus, Strain CCMP3124" /LENGTH=201 /DNA_ID=CAMNT_0028533359 /DNA_START=41 /DNA_END=646 /DNA_ORIENTATION=+